MMKTALISWDYTTQGYPIRVLATILRKHGHGVKIIFPISYLEEKSNPYEPDAVNRKVKGILGLVSDCDVIGLSFLSMHMPMARVLAGAIKKRYPDKTIISGGIHASVRPKEALEFSDYVCIGEGERSLVSFLDELGRGGGAEDVRGISDKKSIEDMKSSSETVKELDGIPIPDFFFDSTYIYDAYSDDWITQDPSMFLPKNKRKESIFSYYLFPDRGCVGECTYCCRPLMKRMSGAMGVRKRSVNNIMEELSFVKENIPHLEKVFIYSDDFMMWSREGLEEFVSRYKKEVDLPFIFLCSPQSYRDDKMGILADTGLLTCCGMGIQSGSPRIREIYKRRFSDSRIRETTNSISRFSKKHGFLASYDFIIDSPWETDIDRMETLKMIKGFPKPFQTLLFTLTFYPGTELHDRALREGIIKDGFYYESLHESTQFLSKRLRANKRDTDLYIKLCEINSIFTLPFFVTQKLYKQRLYKLVDFLAFLAKLRRLGLKKILGRLIDYL